MTPEQTLDWLAEQHKSQCNEDRPVQEWIRSMKSMLPAPVQEPVSGYIKKIEDLIQERDDACSSRDFYKRRADALQEWQSKMRDPERTIVCDILANGHTLEPTGDRYTPPAQPAPVQEPDYCDPSMTVYKLVEMIMSDCGHSTNNQRLLDRIAERIQRHIDATTPPAAQRQWVGLTDEEMNEAMDYWSEDSRSAYGGAHAADGEYVSMISTWRYIEAKLRSKNEY